MKLNQGGRIVNDPSHRDRGRDSVGAIQLETRRAGTLIKAAKVCGHAWLICFGLLLAASPAQAQETVWVDDGLPPGAWGGGYGGDANWAWTTTAPFAGAQAHVSAAAAGAHGHSFNDATPLPVAAGDKIFTYIKLDPANRPRSIMLSFRTTTNGWEQRAYWGENLFNYGTDGTSSRRRIGDVPTGSGWQLLEIPASQVGLEGASVIGMDFALWDGGVVHWDKAGRAPASTGGSGTDIPWIEDALPAGAWGGSYGGDPNWQWVNSPKYSGAVAHQSAAAGGAHGHSLNDATPWPLATGDKIYTYIYIDASNRPREIMLSWRVATDGWEHRAYWGENLLNYGVNGTNSRRRIGDVPGTTGWHRLEVPASQVGLEGQSVIGMDFALYDGVASWDQTGKNSGGGTGGVPGVTVTSGDTTAKIGDSSDPGSFTITRSAASSSALVVNLAFSGTAQRGTHYDVSFGNSTNTATISANTTSTTFTVTGKPGAPANSTIIVTATAGSGYTVGSPANATVTLTSGGTTNPPSGINETNYTGLILPKPGDFIMNILSPRVLELKRINTKPSIGAPPDSWDFVSGTGHTLQQGQFTVKVNSNPTPLTVTDVGFRRTPLYALEKARDLRIENCIYLKLASDIPDDAVVEVTSTRFPEKFTAVKLERRYSPAIHVNQEGYMVGQPKRAMVGAFLGNLRELDLPTTSYKIVRTTDGAQVHTGSMTLRQDVGYPSQTPVNQQVVTVPLPYQKVYEANFTGFDTPGNYQLVVPGMGASLPFSINNGVAMNFLRTYALGLYQQRCGHAIGTPHTRFDHAACHLAGAIHPPASDTGESLTWTLIQEDNNPNDPHKRGWALDPAHPRTIGPRIQGISDLVYPYSNRTQPFDVSGGHHDAGDFNRYTENSARLIHYLVFTADYMSAAGEFDNLGIPESGNGHNDLIDEAFIEAEFLAKMQDTDGGFYFLAYPSFGRYESHVPGSFPEPNRKVWPKNTAVTASAVAALAQIAASPRFRAAYPNKWESYQAKAIAGWNFLFGPNGTDPLPDTKYQKMTHYGDEYIHDDDIAWAAAEMYRLTKEDKYRQKLFAMLPTPGAPSTRLWGWWKMHLGWGNAIRTYYFAGRAGHLPALDASYSTACYNEIVAAANDALKWSNENAYGSSFPEPTKKAFGAGWYFSLDQAADMAVAWHAQTDPVQKAKYVDALFSNLNYEGGTNPVNMTYVTGLGIRRQREIVHEHGKNDHRVLPPSGIPLGNIQEEFPALGVYDTELRNVVFPAIKHGNTSDYYIYPMYDRWGDTWNVQTEFVINNQGRGLMALTVLAKQGNIGGAWKSGTGTITPAAGTPGVLPLNQPAVFHFSSSSVAQPRVVWEAREHEPALGSSFTFTPRTVGSQWIEAEAAGEDGKRVFASYQITADTNHYVWLKSSVPAGGWPSGNWNWVAANPAPPAAAGLTENRVVEHVLASGERHHTFLGASDTMNVRTGAGDKLFVWVWLDPANPPAEIMACWNDGDWEQRAYWGADIISYGTNGTASRLPMGALPPTGQWVRLDVPAAQLGLEGKTINGLSFVIYGGRAYWSSSGRTTN